MISYHQGKKEAVEYYEQQWIVAAMFECRANVTNVAKLGGIDRSSVYRLLKKYNYPRQKFEAFLLK